MAISVQQRIPLTVEDLLRPGMPEKFVELVEGELIEMTPAGRNHNRIAYRIQRLFEQFCEQHPTLEFGGDNEGFLIARDPDTLISPDACLFRNRPESDTTWMTFAPEVVVEVMSPSNNETEMTMKRQRCFTAGTEQFWLVYPDTRSLIIHHHTGRTVTLSGDASTEGEGILAGMPIHLTAIFQK